MTPPFEPSCSLSLSPLSPLLPCLGGCLWTGKTLIASHVLLFEPLCLPKYSDIAVRIPTYVVQNSSESRYWRRNTGIGYKTRTGISHHVDKMDQSQHLSKMCAEILSNGFWEISTSMLIIDSGKPEIKLKICLGFLKVTPIRIICLNISHLIVDIGHKGSHVISCFRFISVFLNCTPLIMPPLMLLWDC